jgi:hypothetical protein
MKGQLEKIGKIGRFFLYLCSAATVMCLCAVFLTAQSIGVTAKDQKAKEAVDKALKVLGGADKIDGIKSLTLEGTEKLGASSNEFEILMLFPDSFIRINNLAASRSYSDGISQETVLPALTFIKDSKINDKLDKKDLATANAVLNARRDVWSYFLIGLLAKAGPTPLAISSGSTPGVFNLTKKNGGAGEIEFDSKTGYPSVVRYKTTRESVEVRFSNRFSVNGIMFPKTITVPTKIGDTTYNIERQINEIQINPKLSLKDFKQFADKSMFSIKVP